jgi:hypothetical protein
MKSNLPPADLRRIWDLADYGKDGRLDKDEFGASRRGGA